jgi:DNA-binding transcriptional LysR family regulator
VRAKRILAEAAQARGEMDEHAGVVRGAVRVATTTADGARVPEVLAAFHREHPGVRLALRHASAEEVLALLRRGAVDLGVLALGSQATEGLAVTSLGSEPLRAITGPDDPFSAVVTDLDGLRGRPFVLPEPGTALRETVMAACQERGFSPVPLIEVGDPTTVRFLVNAGLGVSLVPVSWLHQSGPAVAVAALIEPAPRHALSLLAAGELPPAGRLLAERLEHAFELGGEA